MRATPHKTLKEQAIVITDASSGIGLATAEAAARHGAKLVLVGRSSETLREIADRLSMQDGCHAIAVTADVANREDMKRVALQALTHFGRIDTWVNDAGVSIDGRTGEVGEVGEAGETDSRRLLETNFWGVVNGSLAALPHLRDSGGALINVGSEVSKAVVPLQGMCSGSRHAVKGFTDALRVEVEQLDKAPVTITLIQPTAVDTRPPQRARNDIDRQPNLPTPQIDPEQVADAILKAAVEGGREIKVGTVAKLDPITARRAPALGDRLSAKPAERQRRDKPPRQPEGTRYRPGQAGRVHGAGSARRH